MTYWGTDPVMAFMANLRDLGLEYVSRRFYGMYGGEVSANDADAQSQGQVSVKVGVLGIGTTSPDGSFDPRPLTRSALPSSIYAGKDHGLYFPPEKGDAVWVGFDHGDSTFPRTHGSWWRNTNAAMDHDGSEVPAEFKNDGNGEPITGAPTRRGIKTRYGHGMVFSDAESAPYVALWSGQQTDTGKTAVVRQQITLSDATGVKTAKDGLVDEGIYANTIKGLRVELNDTKQTVLISGNPDDLEGISDNSIKIEELPGGKISIKTKGAPGARNEIILDAATGIVTLNATGAMLISATGGIAMGSGAAPPAPSAPGVSVETGVGAKLINFAGIVTETLGGFIQTSATVAITAATSMIVNTAVFNVNAPAVSLGVPGAGIVLFGGLVTIGNPVAAQQVSNAELLEFLKTHSHIGNLGGPTPLSPADILALQDPSNPALPNPLYVTQTKMV